MAIVNTPDALLSTAPQKLFGVRSEFGFGMFGQMTFGDEMIGLALEPYGTIGFGSGKYGAYILLSGIYQNRTLCIVRPPIPGRRKYGKGTIRMKMYVPNNPRSTPQQANRDKLAAGVAAWQALTPAERYPYNESAGGRHMTGYNWFLHLYMLS